MFKIQMNNKNLFSKLKVIHMQLSAFNFRKSTWKINMKPIAILLTALLFSVVSVAQGATTPDDDAAYLRCEIFINEIAMSLPIWRDGGEVPISRAEDRLDESLTRDFPFPWHNPSQNVLDEWRRAFATSPQDIHDWNIAFERSMTSGVIPPEFVTTPSCCFGPI